MSRAVLGLAVLLAVLFAALALPLTARAEIKPEHRQEVAKIKTELGKVQGLLGKKDTEGAQKIIADCETRLQAVCTGAGIQDTDKLVMGVYKLLEQRKLALSKKTGGAVPATVAGSFENDIAPILVKNCIGCHDDSAAPKGGLSLVTFDGLAKGGRSGLVIVPGNVNQSSLIRKINLTTQGKMPPDKALAADEIKKLTAWVAGGAKFTGDNAKPLAEIAAAPAVKPSEVKIEKASGTETVSFSKDIAPWMVQRCVGCHSGNTPRAGFSLETFEKLMQGGLKGRVVIPGKPDVSRIHQLVVEQDPIKMPPGQQVLLLRKNAEALTTWIEEGAKFDGTDAKATLRSLVPDVNAEKAKEMAAMSPDQWLVMRQESTEALWKTFSKTEVMNKSETANLLLAGSVSESRLKEIGAWGEEHLNAIRSVAGLKETPAWKGKLAVFVFKERFDYTEFSKSNEDGRDLPKETIGHSRVEPTMQQAYICVQDVGESGLGLRALLCENLTVAALQRTRPLPMWLSRGLGLYLARKADPKNGYFVGLAGESAAIVSALEKPGDVFNDDSYSTATIAPTGFVLVDFMVKSGGAGGEQTFARFLASMLGGSDVNKALTEVYKSDGNVVGLAFSRTLATTKTTPKKKN